MAETVSGHQQNAFTAPQNIPAPGHALDANVVRTNDNTLRGTYNAHDADPGIHLQSGTLASRPAAGVVGRKWFTTDTRQLFYDTGAGWVEADYAPAGGSTPDQYFYLFATRI